jgi:hypothetical protein
MLQRQDYDSAWKEALENYFQPFLELCVPDLYAAIDWSRPHIFLDKELQKIVRDAETGKQYADKLIKVWLLDGQETWILIHVEVQGKKETDFARRMYDYHHRISDRYNRWVESIAILCDNNGNWRPHTYTCSGPTSRLTFTFFIIKLLDWKERWEELDRSSNPFATVIMAHLKTQETRRNQLDRKHWKFTLIRRLYERGYQKQDILSLFHFIDWIMELPEPLATTFDQELVQYQEEQRMKYVTHIERTAISRGLKQGLEQGLEQGLHQGEHKASLEMLRRLLGTKFKSVPKALSQSLQRLSVQDLKDLVVLLLSVESLAAFKAEVAKRSPQAPAQSPTEPASKALPPQPQSTQPKSAQPKADKPKAPKSKTSQTKAPQPPVMESEEIPVKPTSARAKRRSQSS